MPIDNPGLAFTVTSLAFTFKVGFVLLGALFFIFSLIVVRQVNLMTETVTTEIAGFLKVFSFFLALLGLGIVILFIKLI